jgi:hypothetical protein
MPWCPAFQGDQVGILITVSRDREAVGLHAVSMPSPHGLQLYYIRRCPVEADFARVLLGDMLLLDVPGRRLRSIHWEGTPMRNRTRSTVAVGAPPVPGSPVLPDRRTPRNPRCRRLQQRGAAHRAGQYQSQQPERRLGVGHGVAGGTGHLVPTEISGSLVDNVIHQTLFTFAQAKGGGHANHNQPTVKCTTSDDTGTLGDFLNPGDMLPPGTSPTDSVTFTLTVIAVRHS